MANNDPNRSRKTYSFFRTAPASPTSTEIAVSTGLTISGDRNNILIGIDNSVIPLSSGSTLVTAQLSGSLQRLSTGETYLVAVGGISITTSSKGQVFISGSNDTTVAGAGLTKTGNALNVDTNQVVMCSGSSMSGPLILTSGLTGSLFEVSVGVPYLQAGRGIKLTSQSNGSILVASTTGSNVSTSYSVPNNQTYIIVSGSVSPVTMSLSDHPHNWQEHFFKDGDGKSPTFPIIISASLGMVIDGQIGTEISSSYGACGIVFTGNNLWSMISSR